MRIEKSEDVSSAYSGAKDEAAPGNGLNAAADKASSGTKDEDQKGKKKKEKKKEDELEMVPYHHLYKFATKGDLVLLFFGLIGALWTAASMPLFTWIFGNITNTLGQKGSSYSTEITKLCLYFTGLGGITWVAEYVKFTGFNCSGIRQANRIRMAYLKAVLKQDCAFFDKYGTSGGLLVSINEDTAKVQDGISEKVGLFIQTFGTFVAAFIISFIRAWDITLLVCGILPFLALAGGQLSSLNSRYSARSSAAFEGATQLSQEALSSMKTVAAFGMEKALLLRFSDKLQPSVTEGKRQALGVGLIVGAVQWVAFSAYAATMIFGTWRVSQGARTGGDVLTVLFSCLMGGFSLGQAVPYLSILKQGQVAGAKVFKVIDRKPAMDVVDDADESRRGGRCFSPLAPAGTSDLEAGGPTSTTGIIPASCTGRIDFENVTFRYPIRPDVPIFQGLSLSVPAGRTVALVGESGSGKSTVVALVERFYDPEGGRVLLDGLDLRRIDLAWLRRQMGLVNQEPTLFATTIRENILYGRKGASESDIVAACKSANALSFIERLPQGLDTPVGERGTQLSGGQKQRIAIARAVLRNPRILLLDEATSALDAESERVVQEALDNLMVGRTTIVVAHRLSTVRHSDSIAVVYRGQVVEQGSHDELTAKPDGAYSSLIKHQQRAGRAIEKGGRKARISDAGLDAILPPEEDPDRAYSPLSAAKEVVVVKEADAGAVVNKEDSAPGKGGGLKKRGKEKKEKKAKAKEDEFKVPASRLFAYNKPEWKFLLIGALGSLGAGAMMPIFSVAISEIIGAFYLPSKSQIMRKGGIWSAVFEAIAIHAFYSFFMQQFGMVSAGQKLAFRVRMDFFEALLRQEIGWFDLPENTSGALGTKLSKDAMYVKAGVGDQLAALLMNIVVLVAAMVIAFTGNWKLTLVILSTIPVMAFAGALHAKMMMGGASSTDKAFQDANGMAMDAFANVRVVMAYGLGSDIQKLYKSMIAKPSHELYVKSHTGGITMGFSLAAMFWVYALAFWYGAKLIKSGEINLTQLMRVFFAIVLAAMGAGQTQAAFPDLGKAKNAIKNIFSIVDRVPLIRTADDSIIPASCEGRIELDQVHYRYANRPDVPIFQGLSLSVPAGRTVALVGESGSGKSTVVALVERFYDPEGGRVLLDGLDLRRIDLAWLRRQMGLVNQEPVLFQGSIRENILFGSPEASESDILAACKSANALSFIERLPQGLDTPVGERGTQLSGGQKQRIAIARAVLRNPRILLLDEATSALDAESERVVQEALDNLMVGRTTIVVAHRLSTVRHADTIAVIHRGRVVEQGRHEVLLAQKGAYAALVQLQMAATSAEG